MTKQAMVYSCVSSVGWSRVMAGYGTRNDDVGFVDFVDFEIRE